MNANILRRACTFFGRAVNIHTASNFASDSGSFGGNTFTMFDFNLTVAWSWWQWSLLSAGALFAVWLLFLALVNRRPKRRPRSTNWKRYNPDSRYL